MATSVSCECDKLHPVTIVQAGSSLPCSCGRRVVVPSRAEFDGREVFHSAATIDRRLYRMIEKGELPRPGACGRCGQVGQLKYVELTMVCERSTSKVWGGEFFLFLPFYFFSVMVWGEEERYVEIRGRDTDLPAPVLLCEKCENWLQPPARARYLAIRLGLLGLCVALAFLSTWWIAAICFVVLSLLLGVFRSAAIKGHQDELMAILREPIFQQLFERYPQAKVVWPASTSVN